MPLGNLKNVLDNLKILKRAGPFQNPENAQLSPSRDCPKSWNGPTISRWLGRFRILKMPMGNLEIAPNPENARNTL